MKRAICGLCVVALMGACAPYDEDNYHAHRAYYYQRSDRPYTYYRYGDSRYYGPAFSSDFPYTERAYFRPSGVRVYRY